jgi:hypothetical protein
VRREGNRFSAVFQENSNEGLNKSSTEGQEGRGRYREGTVVVEHWCRWKG